MVLLGGEIFRTHPQRLWGPTSLLYKWYRVPFPRVKRPEHGVNNRRRYSAEFRQRVELCLYSFCGPSWPVKGKTLPLPLLLTRKTSVSRSRKCGNADHHLSKTMQSSLSLAHARNEQALSVWQAFPLPDVITEIKQDEMGWAFSTHGRNKKCCKNFSMKPSTKISTSQNKEQVER